MWVQRTEDEIKEWNIATAREARTQGLIFAVGTWLGITAILAGGWIAGGRFGVVAESAVAGGGFWSRFPVFAVCGLPVAYWMLRRTRKEELKRAELMTICPKCDTAGEENAGAPCECGGNFVLQSTVRWVDDESK
jgi:hypothetical protein